MPTVFSHVIAGAALARLIAPCDRMRGAMALAAAAAVLPDADVIGLRMGIPYGDVLGHRGFSHSLMFAGIVAAAAAALFPCRSAADRWRIFAAIFAATASHGLLDALTDGGRGVAFFAPFDDTRYFFPFTPIRVAPLRVGAMFTRRGAVVMASEVVFVWIPAAAMAYAAVALRCRGAGVPSRDRQGAV